MYEDDYGGGDYYDDSDRYNDGYYAGHFDIDFYYYGWDSTRSDFWNIINFNWGVDIDISVGRDGDTFAADHFLDDMIQENGYEAMAAQDGYAEGDCPTCPNNAKNWDRYTDRPYSIFDRDTWGNFGHTKTYIYYNGAWNEQRYITGDVPIGPAGAFNLIKSFRSALSLSKGGLTNVGRALQKHPNILKLIGRETSSVTTNAARNEAGAQALKYIVRNGAQEVKVHKSFGKVIEYKLPNGLGARFKANTNEFIGFLGRGL